jgi:hypothetical protein
MGVKIAGLRVNVCLCEADEVKVSSLMPLLADIEVNQYELSLYIFLINMIPVLREPSSNCPIVVHTEMPVSTSNNHLD